MGFGVILLGFGALVFGDLGLEWTVGCCRGVGTFKTCCVESRDVALWGLCWVLGRTFRCEIKHQSRHPQYNLYQQHTGFSFDSAKASEHACAALTLSAGAWPDADECRGRKASAGGRAGVPPFVAAVLLFMAAVPLVFLVAVLLLMALS